jgi:drug/metabolite transporter (DMT)-like permease
MHKGLQLIFLTALISGCSVFANKIFVSATDPLVFTAIRNGVVVLILSALVLWRKQIPTFTGIKKSDWLRLLIVGFVGGGVAFGFFFTGLSQIGAVQGNVIHKTLFIWVALLAVPWLGERFTKLQFVGLVLLLLATFVLGGPLSFAIKPGSFMVLTATLLWALENVYSKQLLSRLSPLVVAWSRMAFGLPVLFFAVTIFGKGTQLFLPKTYLLLPLLSSSLLLTGYVLTWYYGLKVVPVTIASGVLVIAPSITLVLTGLLITHQFSFVQILSVLTALGGAVLIARLTRSNRLLQIFKT